MGILWRFTKSRLEALSRNHDHRRAAQMFSRLERWPARSAILLCGLSDVGMGYKLQWWIFPFANWRPWRWRGLSALAFR